jgi:hypothetical protein
MSLSACIEFDFDYWRRLASDDPGSFEVERSRVVEAVIAGAAPELRQRMRGLQWRIDRLRERSPNPMAACLRLNGMMMDSVFGKDGLMDVMQRLGSMEITDHPGTGGATIIPFRRPAAIPPPEPV